MTVFLDSSALVKRYADEVGARGDPSRSEGGVVCAIARVEVPAALWRKHRLGELDARHTAVLVDQFEWEWLGDGDAEPLFAAVAVKRPPSSPTPHGNARATACAPTMPSSRGGGGRARG